jgi:flagellar motor switch/type III secretory pathway protein FliN
MASAVAASPAQPVAKSASEAVESPRDRLVNAAPTFDKSGDARWRPLLALPGQLTVDLPLLNFTVANLLELGVGSVMRTGWQVVRDVPLRVNDTLIGWSEFEAVGSRMAVRLTELA